MPGFPTNTQQYRLYMKLREAGLTQVSAAVEGVEKPSKPPFCGIIRHRKHPNE